MRKNSSVADSEDDADAATQNRASVAAIVNAAIVLAIPVAFGLFAWTRPAGNVPVTPPGTPVTLVKVGSLGLLLLPFVPLAAVAAWRTQVHAVRYRLGAGDGAQGIAEGGIVGLVVAVAILAGGIFSHPADAPPYVMFYGGIAFLAGLALGFLLWISASLVMRGSAR
jgi:hypothetical protein